MKKHSIKKPMMKNINAINTQAGLTIIELLVAMTLGVVVMAAAVSMQVSFQQGFKATDNKLAMQTNARFAYEFISKSLREMGSAGCLTAQNYVDRTDSVTDQYRDGIEIYKRGTSFQIAFIDPAAVRADFRYKRELVGFDDSTIAATPPPLDWARLPNPGSDVLVIKGAIGPTYVFDADTLFDSNHASLQINMARYPFIDLRPEQYAVISQCAGAEIFKITGTDDDVRNRGIISHGIGSDNDDNEFPVFATGPGGLTFSSSAPSELRRMATVSYYIADNTATPPVPTLFRSIDGQAVPDPLVEGVEQMQILYGVDGDADKVPDTYRTAAALDGAAMANVVAVRLTFIMRSRERVYKNPVLQTLSIPGQADFVITDRFARQVFTTTVTLRNRLTGNRT
jgi:type IV pilus assembly protein PilW